MANLNESAIWEPGIRQIETSDPVMGGANGVTNTAPRQLANRTVFLKELADGLGTDKANKVIAISAGTGLTGGGTLAANRTLAVDFASAAEAKTGNISNKSIHPSALAQSAYYLANSRYDGNPTEGNANDFEVGTRYLCSAAITNTPIPNVWWDGSYALIETRYAHTGGQKIQIAWGYDKPNLAERSYIAGAWTEWRTMVGADWASNNNDGIRNKPSTLNGFGIKDWKIETVTTANSSQANTVGNGIFSFATVTTDAPKWSTGDGIGANKMLQLGAESWNTQLAIQGYGECAWLRSRRESGGEYKDWKRLDGGDWAATEKQAGYIANKPNLVLQDRKISSGKGLKSGGTLAADITLEVDKATAAEVTAGTADKYADAALLKAELDKKLTTAGFNTELLQKFSQSHLRSGYTKLPNGTILQWGSATAVNGTGTWTYPIQFPNGALQVLASQDSAAGVTYTVGANVDSTDSTTLKTQAKVTSTLTSGSDVFFIFAIGY